LIVTPGEPHCTIPEGFLTHAAIYSVT